MKITQEQKDRVIQKIKSEKEELITTYAQSSQRIDELINQLKLSENKTGVEIATKALLPIIEKNNKIREALESRLRSLIAWNGIDINHIRDDDYKKFWQE